MQTVAGAVYSRGWPGRPSLVYVRCRKDVPSPCAQFLRAPNLRRDDSHRIYGLDDRYRGIYGTRKVLLMSMYATTEKACASK